MGTWWDDDNVDDDDDDDDDDDACLSVRTFCGSMVADLVSHTNSRIYELTRLNYSPLPVECCTHRNLTAD